MARDASGPSVVIGIDVGTSSSKGVACLADGEIVAEARLAHRFDTPAPGHVEQDADAVWWHDVQAIARSLTDELGDRYPIAGVCVTTTGPCLVPVDGAGRPLRPGILYGVDVRATDEIAELEARIGRRGIRSLGGMDLSSQSVGPKIQWIARHEPGVLARTARFHTATSYLVSRLTGASVIDRHQACYFTPFYSRRRGTWSLRHAAGLDLERRLPPIRWATEIAGTVTDEAAAATGLPQGTPVLVGTSDGLTEAAGVGALEQGTAVLAYGSTTGVTTFADPPRPVVGLWASEGIFPGRRSIGGALSTTGTITSWFRETFAHELPQATDAEIRAAHATLEAEAAASPPGAGGLLFLPYLNGERTPFADPLARGTLVGLTLRHTRGDVYRAILEGIAFGVRQLLDAMADQGAGIERIRVAGGGTGTRLALQLVSDATGLTQEVPRVTVGASYGAAFLAGLATGLVADDAPDPWTRIVERIEPDPSVAERYEAMYALFRQLYRDSAPANHALVLAAAAERAAREPA
jgi:xylulokinase